MRVSHAVRYTFEYVFELDDRVPEPFREVVCEAAAVGFRSFEPGDLPDTSVRVHYGYDIDGHEMADIDHLDNPLDSTIVYLAGEKSYLEEHLPK